MPLPHWRLSIVARALCIQADTSTGNPASQKVLEKVGFKKDGVIRKHFFSSGKWRDSFLCNILREEWKEPKILARKET